ncbi:MAG: Tad domain-containing protein [Sphingomonadaceae bacterium]|nr:Tad domain-containing protein [Sphingomonadaceae bacterium]
MIGRSPAKARSRGGSLLARLRADTGGNTLAMVAAAILPIAAMIGSGLDMSRAYLAQAKLQNACDAGALAARRFMASAAFTAGAEDEGERFFYFNFPEGTMGTGDITLDIGASATNSSVVEISASTEVPTTIMALFGQDEIPIAVECDADQDYVNNDIMLVLDVTLSMNCQAGDLNCAMRTTEHTTSRLRRLREGAAGLYRALEGAAGVRTRYGFMPYSHAVNVGRDLNDLWVREPASYRRGACTWPTTSTCVLTATSGTTHNLTWRNTWRGGTSAGTQWQTNVNSGCIEERNSISQTTILTTVSQNDINTTSTTDATRKWAPYDPAWQQAGRFPDGTTTSGTTYPTLNSFCPRPARRLATYATEAAFQAEMNRIAGSQTYPTASPYTGRAAGGYTYHDIGIIWGARYLSSTGMFQADNPTTFNNIRVDKHIVFLTDGVQTAAETPYTSYANERWDRRLGNSGTQLARHQARFLAACSRARSMGMTIWVIALDEQDTASISPCATSTDHFYVSDGSDLEEIFELIGRGIGRLRLTR